MSDLNKLKIRLRFINTITNAAGDKVDMYLISEDPMISIGVPHGDNIANQIEEGLRSIQALNLKPVFKSYLPLLGKKLK